MRVMRRCWFLLLFLVVPSLLFGRTDYSTFDSDSPEVQGACQRAVEQLGSGRGAIAIGKKVVDIIGIPKGVAGGGMAVAGQVAEVETALTDLGAKVSETEIKMELPGDILFDFDKYDIRPDAGDALGKVAVVIRAYPGKAVRIEGHTDSKGSEDYNMKLSLQRAESVKRWLQDEENLEDTPFETKGWGETKPRATNETDEGRQQNRRVEITIKK